MEDENHCDDIIHLSDYPICLRYFLLVNRLPAVDKCIIVEMKGEPVCFATFKNKKVRLVMASRFGDVGITKNLSDTHGYDKRVSIKQLSNFTCS